MTRPKGPLPPRVYWVRRFLVLGVALAMVFGISRLLGSSPGVPDAHAARPVSATASSSAATPGPTEAPTTSAASPGARQGTVGTSDRPTPRKTKTPLAVPTGPCIDSDVNVEPDLERDAIAGTKVTFVLNLTTERSPACTWTVSADTVVLRLTSGTDRIWSSQDCPSSVPRQRVVLRKDQVTTVDVAWNGQRSDADCSRTTSWAFPGFYNATAAALGADPVEKQFELLVPPRPTITPSPTAEPEESDEPEDEADDEDEHGASPGERGRSERSRGRD